MSPAILEASAAVSTAIAIPQRNLLALNEKLASLRYLIILTARWAASDSVPFERRQLMNRDLERLRREYSHLIDEIAMNFGVQTAMDAKDDVENNIIVPKGIRPPEVREVEDQFSI